MSLDLMPGLPLLCGLESDTLPPDFNYTTRWRLPGREIINSTRPERFVLSENLVSIGGRSIPGTVLVVLQISYQDAGMYTCEGRSTDPGASPQWAADSFELQLNCELTKQYYCQSNNYAPILLNILQWNYYQTQVQ